MSVYKLTVPVKPRTKQRPRLGRGRRVYTPQATTDFENVIRDAWRTSGHPTLDGPVKVTIRLDKTTIAITVTELPDDLRSVATGDVDNYAKAVLDGLQGEGGAFINDRQVWELTVSKWARILQKRK